MRGCNAERPELNPKEHCRDFELRDFRGQFEVLARAPTQFATSAGKPPEVHQTAKQAKEMQREKGAEKNSRNCEIPGWGRAGAAGVLVAAVHMSLSLFTASSSGCFL